MVVFLFGGRLGGQKGSLCLILEKKEKNNWQDIYKNSLSSLEDIENFFEIRLPQNFPYKGFIPRDLAKKIKEEGESGPLWQQFVPSYKEMNTSGLDDPIGDHQKFVAPKIIHRYPQRVLYLSTIICPVDCRSCFRKNERNSPDEIFKTMP